MIRIIRERLHREPAVPSYAERTVFEMFAHQAAQVSGQLAQGKQLSLGAGAPVDLGKSDQVELVLLSIQTAARDHVRRGEDLLALIERVSAMLNASPSGRSGDWNADAGLHLLRAIAISELLEHELAARFTQYAPLSRLAESTTAALVAGFLARFGGNLPTEVQRAFPRFARAVRNAWRPVHAKRRLLPWLVGKA